jgi:hypothetical protein
MNLLFHLILVLIVKKNIKKITQTPMFPEKVIPLNAGKQFDWNRNPEAII